MGARWQDLTSAELAALDPARTVAILPVGAIEQHGPHLPLGTDTLIAEALAAALLDAEPNGATVLVLPTLAIGHSPEHQNFTGTLTLPAAATLELWTEVGRGIARSGLLRLLILNAHGGQSAIVDLAAVALRAELGLTVARGNYFALGVPEGLFDADEVAHGLHGGELETSLMLHLAPALVRREALADFPLPGGGTRLGRLPLEGPIGLGWLAEDLGPHGVAGRATRATAAKGRIYFEFLVAGLSKVVAELARGD
jgi:creatinine amidohydrolase